MDEECRADKKKIFNGHSSVIVVRMMETFITGAILASVLGLIGWYGLSNRESGATSAQVANLCVAMDKLEREFRSAVVLMDARISNNTLINESQKAEIRRLADELEKFNKSRTFKWER